MWDYFRCWLHSWSCVDCSNAERYWVMRAWNLAQDGLPCVLPSRLPAEFTRTFVRAYRACRDWPINQRDGLWF